MSKSERPNHDTRMTVTVRGREVAMQFTEKPNPQVALQVKQEHSDFGTLSSEIYRS